jgi:hypothetical protein
MLVSLGRCASVAGQGGEGWHKHLRCWWFVAAILRSDRVVVEPPALDHDIEPPQRVKDFAIK